jgi:Glyoxalase superfamily protein/ClpX C4-type zinc finger
MLTHKDAKMMARSLREALGNRNVLLAHSDCLEIVARQFGLADWNTFVAKFPAEEERETQTRRPDTAAPTADISSCRRADVPAPSLSGVETRAKSDETAGTITSAAPWTTCSFCGKSRPEVRIVFGGCGGWEGFRARRNPESGERSNIFICNECTALAAQVLASSADMAKESDATGSPSATQ